MITFVFFTVLDTAAPSGLKSHSWLNPTWVWAAFVFLSVFFFQFFGLYKRNIVTTRYRQFVLLTKSLAYTCLLMVILDLLVTLNISISGAEFHFNLFLSSVFVIGGMRAFPFRSIFNFVTSREYYQHNVLIVGDGTAGQRVKRSLNQAASSGFVVKGLVSENIDGPVAGNDETLGGLDDLEDILSQVSINEIVIAADDTPYLKLIEIVDRCLASGKVVRIHSNLLDVIAQKMDVEYYGDIPVVMLSQQPLEGANWLVKRAFDVVMSAVALVVLLPVFVVVALGIKLSSNGPVLFEQIRIGKNGYPFKFLKFRSMHINQEDTGHREYVKNFINANVPADEGEIKVFKMTTDPRIFPFGKFIRKTSIDEFPQFINVLKGEMSLVGPRPCLDYEWESYSDWHKHRLNVLPGCAGLWQAVGRSTVTFEEMVVLDLYYISNISIWLDIKIILQTFPVIFLAKGGH